MRFAAGIKPSVSRRNLLLEPIEKIRRCTFHNQFGFIFDREQILEVAFPQQFAAMLKSAIDRWGPVVKASGFVAEE